MLIGWWPNSTWITVLHLLAAVAAAIMVPAVLGWCGTRLYRPCGQGFQADGLWRGPRRAAACAKHHLCCWLYGWLMVALLSIPIVCAYWILALLQV